MPRLRTLTPGASPMHHFGSEVRRAREAADMTQSELGDLVPCDKATVSRTEAGLTSPDEAFARACDAAFPAMNGWFTRFWKDAQTWGAAFPASLREFATYEAQALTLWTFEHSVMPGLLQAEDYARAVLERHPNATAEQVAERVAGRLARQAVLDRDDPPVFWVLLDENVLHREIGDGMTTDSPAIVTQVSTRFDTLRTDAYRGADSLLMIEEMAEKWTL